MKISVDDQELFTLSEVQKNVIMNDIPTENFVEDMKRRLEWVLMNKFHNCMERLKKEWIPKLKENGVTSIPTDDLELAEIILSQSNYQNRSARIALESQSLNEK